MAKDNASDTTAKKTAKKEGDTSILSSNLLEPGAMFKVGDKTKDNTFSPGSLGFVSLIRGIDDSYQDVAKVLAVMTRRGKGGKNRLMSVNICTPIFYIGHEGFDKLLPENGARKHFIHIERETPMATDVMKLPPLDFLGFATAISKRIKYMSDQCQHKKWPEDKGNPINVLKRMPDYFEEDPDTYLDKFTTTEFREQFVLEARRMTSALIRVHLQLDITRAEAELHAAEFLAFVNNGEFIPKDAKEKKNEYAFTEDNALLERTIKFHTNLKKEINTLYKIKKK
jgi:hypothetical protein